MLNSSKLHVWRNSWSIIYIYIYHFSHFSSVCLKTQTLVTTHGAAQAYEDFSSILPDQPIRISHGLGDIVDEAMGRIIWGDKVPLFEERSILTLLSLVHVISKKVAIFVAPPFFSIAFPCDKMANHLNHNWMILDPFLVKSPNSHRFTGWNSARCWEVVERDFHHQNHWRSRPLLLKCHSGLRVREYIYIIKLILSPYY